MAVLCTVRRVKTSLISRGLLVGMLFGGCATENPSPGTTAAASSEPAASSNPLLTKSTLYLEAPRFDLIREEHYMPAFVEGMKQESAEMQAIANQAEPPTFENTIVAMEKAGQLLRRVNYIFGGLSGTMDDPAMEKIQNDVAPLLAKHADDIHLDAKLFARVDALYQQREKLGLDAVDKRLLERYHLDFVRSGAQLSPADQALLRKLNEEESSLSAKYSELQIKEMNAGAIVVDDVHQLAGLSDSDIANAAAAAQARGLKDKWVLPLINTTGQPELASLTNRELRQKIFEASIRRGHSGGPNDVTKLVARLAQIRATRAKLLGFASFDAYTLDDQMAKTPEAALQLLTQLGTAAVGRAKLEAADMQKLIDAQKGGFQLQQWDWAYYSEQVRKAKYALDDSQVRPYFELDHVLKDGVFYAANKLYGVTFKQRTDLPVYQPDVRVWEVFDADGSTIGLIYTDYFARESKHGGAWMNSLVDQSDLLNEKPVVCNTLNIPKPAPGQPALLTFDEVSTMFHEFGHALHGLFSKVKYPYMSGTNTPRDYVEFPSQFNENWALEPTVFANYAKHYQTGAPMPAELVAKIRKASTFNEGFETLEATESALLDLEWHALPANADPQEVEKFEQAALHKHGVDLASVAPRYHTTYFSHIWDGGYAAGYYAYMWTAVLASDAYAWFTEHGGLTAANGKIFRDEILSRGNTVDTHELFVKFRGREPSVKPLLEKRGL